MIESRDRLLDQIDLITKQIRDDSLGEISPDRLSALAVLARCWTDVYIVLIDTLSRR